jgi:hypothetical protein
VKRTSPFKSPGASVHSTTGSRGVRISGSNARYTMFRGSVKSTVYTLHSPGSPSLRLLTSPCAITFQLDSNARYTMFRGSVKSTGYPLHSPVSPSLPLPWRHRVPSHFNCTLMLDTPCSEVVCRVLATHSIRQFSLHFPSLASPCAITFQLHCTMSLLVVHLLNTLSPILWYSIFFIRTWISANIMTNVLVD